MAAMPTSSGPAFPVIKMVVKPSAGMETRQYNQYGGDTGGSGGLGHCGLALGARAIYGVASVVLILTYISK